MNKLFFLIAFLHFTNSNAQSLLDKLNAEQAKEPQYEISTFKSTRIGIGHSVEVREKNVLEISVMSRFWDFPESVDHKDQSFLVDKVSNRFALEFSATDKFTLGAGGNTWDGVFDGFLKYQLVRQTGNSNKNPFTVTLFQNAAYRSYKKFSIASKFDGLKNRFAFTSQLLIARKFNRNFSLQISPTFIHRTSSKSTEDPNNQFALGFGGKYNISKHASIISEYFYVANPLKSIETYDAFTIGINWELSYILLQFHFTNARTMSEDVFITQTTNNFNSNDGNLHFGFNTTFTIQLDKKRRKKSFQLLK